MDRTSIRIRKRSPEKFSNLKEIIIDEELGIKAVIGKMNKDQDSYRIQSLLFNTDKDIGKVWSLKEAKEWTKTKKDELKIAVSA